MEQLASNIKVLYSPEPIPGEGIEDYVKIALVGSTDLVDGGQLDWYTAFINGLVTIAGRESNHAVNIFKNLNYLVFNCKTPKVANGSMSVDNPEFVQHTAWLSDCCDLADGIFINFLKRSTSVMPLFWFSQYVKSGKLVVRVPMEADYVYSGLVNMECQRFNVPMFPGKMGNVMSVIQAFFSFIPKMQLLNNPNIQLPE